MENITWVVFAALAAVFFVMFVLSLVVKDRPTSTTASRQFDPLRPAKDWGTRQAMKHAQQEMAWQNTQAEYERHPLSIKRSHEMSDKGHELWQKKQQVEQATAELQRQQVLEATTQRIDVSTLNEFKKLEKVHDLEIKRLEEAMRVEVDKIRQTKDLDFQYFQKETDARVDAALRLQLLSTTQAQHILQMLVAVRAELYRLLTSRQPTELILAQAEDYKTFIKGMEDKLGRLIQGDTGQDAGRGDEASIS